MSNELEVMEKKAETEMAPVLARAAAFMVNSEETYVAADTIIVEIKGKVKKLEVELSPAKEAATRSWKAMTALWKKFVDEPLEACKTLDRKRYAFQQAENRKRQEAAETLRREEERKQAEEKLKLAERMEAAGMQKQAEAVLDAPSAPVSVPEPVRVEKPEGQSYVSNWQARVVDETKVPREFCSPDMVKLGRYGKLMKGKANVPGVEFTDIGSVRRRL
jgi:hypothetical protein